MSEGRWMGRGIRVIKEVGGERLGKGGSRNYRLDIIHERRVNKKERKIKIRKKRKHKQLLNGSFSTLDNKITWTF